MPTAPESAFPSTEEAKLAIAASRQLAPFTKKDLPVRIADSNEIVLLPAEAVRLLVDILSTMAVGNAATLIPICPEHTVQEAAGLLGVSRPFLIRQLEEKPALP